jgi:hypothetical protein
LINAGSNALAPPSSFDQRGPGYPRIFDTTVDIGAVEVTPPGYDFIFADGFE